MEVRHVSLQDMLRARDERAARQRRFLDRYALPLISFTMNIAGSIKNDELIQRAFEEGVHRISTLLDGRAWNAPGMEKTVSFTGCEALWAVQADAETLKRAMCLVEEQDALGRLFDVDVIDADGRHLSREAERNCLICSGPVRACARSRAHSAEELFAKAHEIMEAYFREQYACRIGEWAQKALLYEAVTTPKPGLVDCENSGSHRDMDLFSFVNSACALRPYFEECARLGMHGAEPEKLQLAGMLAEDAMMKAVHANTHKGAIFSLGLLCCAAGNCGETAKLDEMLSKAGEMGSHFLDQMKKNGQTRTAGECQYAAYGLTGIRGEAASGFRTVRDVSLPVFEKAMQKTHDLNTAGLETLLHLMVHLNDSNLIRRAGLEGQRWAMGEARKLLSCGYTIDDLRKLNDCFVERNLSPGGSADLLAITYFLYFFERGESITWKRRSTTNLCRTANANFSPATKAWRRRTSTACSATVPCMRWAKNAAAIAATPSRDTRTAKNAYSRISVPTSTQCSDGTKKS